ncbi:embigin isoform X2 [Cricetulus griseus]|uniref:Embigin n=1 Tax=Cricetulus griseus TaxID=10029 RepID=A0A9J7GNG9_CRIGR|nr:embigin isoform X2 [Cricetulus griseus]
MRSLTGLRALVAPDCRLLLLCFLAATRPYWAEGDPTDSSFTSLPVREEMMAKYSNLSLESHNISLTEESSAPVEKNITLESPSDLELICQFTTSGDLNSVNVTWKKDDEFFENIDAFNTTKTGNTLYSQYRFIIFNSKQMGNYSCFFGEKKRRGTFNIKVPSVHGKNKPLITYVGDSTVLKCECQDCLPLNWTWYTSNGSVQVPIDVLKNDKYVINGSHANATRLRVKHLLEEDGGSYWCRAVFPLGESEEHIELVVLSFMVPLKPFLAIIAEVILLVAIILLCEVYTQKKKSDPDNGKEFEQIEQLKSDDSNGIENNVPRLRKILEETLPCCRLLSLFGDTRSIKCFSQMAFPCLFLILTAIGRAAFVTRSKDGGGCSSQVRINSEEG